MAGSGTSRRRRGRLRAADARPPAPHGPPVRHLRPDHRRGHAGRGPALLGAGRPGGRRHDPPLRHRVAVDAGVRRPAPRARPPVSQRHAGEVLRAVRPRRLPDRDGRAPGTELAGDAHGPRARRVRVQPARAGGRRLPRHGHPAARHRRRSHPQRPPRAVAPEVAQRRADQLPVRRPHGAEQADRGHHPARGALQAVRRLALPLHLRRPLRGHAALLQHAARPHRRARLAGGPLPVHGPGARRRAGHVLPRGERVHLDERARRLLRPAGRGHGGRPAGARVLVHRRSRHAGRGWRAVLAETLRDGRRAARHPRLRRRRAGEGHRGAAAAPAGILRGSRGSRRCARSSRDSSNEVQGCESRIRHSTLRVGDSRRRRVPLPPDRRADGRAPRRRGAHHVRARVHDVAERVPGRQRPHPRRHGAALRQRAGPRHGVVQPLFRLDLQQPAHAGRRDGVAEAAGPVVPGAHRPPPAEPSPVRRADLLHVPLRADGARAPDRAGQEPAGADGPRRAGHPPRHLPGHVRPARGPRLQHRRRAALPERHVHHQRDHRGNRRMRRRAAAAGARPAAASPRKASSRRTTPRLPRR